MSGGSDNGSSFFFNAYTAQRQSNPFLCPVVKDNIPKALPNRSLPYTKIRKMDCNVNTITLFFRNQEYIKKHKITVLNVKLSLLQTENYAVEIRKTESESKNGSIRHIAQHPVTQRIIQKSLPTTLFPVHDKGFSAKPKRLFRHAGKTLRHPQTHFPAAPKSPFDRNKAR